VPGNPRVLMFIEHGGYPLPLAELHAAGYDVQLVPGIRRALAELRAAPPAAVVAEFNFNPRYGDRVSNLESLLAGVERLTPPPPVVVLGQPGDAQHIERLASRHHLAAVLYPPLDPAAICAGLRAAGVPGAHTR